MERRQIMLISDMHLTSSQPVARTDDGAVTCLKKFEWLLNCARHHNAVIVQAGDMFDKPRDWYMLPRIAALLRKYAVTFYAVYGQHDSYMRSKENRPATSLGVLAKAGLVHVLGTIPHLIEWKDATGDAWEESGWELYGASWGDTAPTTAESDRRKILVRHAPIALEPAYVGHENIDAAHTLKRMKEFDIILCGDVHRSFHLTQGRRHILNTGPMFRYAAEEYNFTHVPSFATVEAMGDNIGDVAWYEMPCEPAEVVLTREHIQESASNKALLGFMDLMIRPGLDKNQRAVNITHLVQKALKDPNVPQEVVDLMMDIMGAVSRGAIHGTA